MNMGILYGIGVGPGDPELITLKAVRALKSVSAVFAAASREGKESLAMQIAEPHLKESVSLNRLIFPMTGDKGKLRAAWENNARQILNILEMGMDAAFLTLGDPLIYSTFGYLIRSIQTIAPKAQIRAIPGVTSYQAAAACTGRVLVEGDETFTVVSGINDPESIWRILKYSESCVVLKAYRNFESILDIINRLDLGQFCTFVSRCGLDGEIVIEDLRNFSPEKPDYLSLILMRKA